MTRFHPYSNCEVCGRDVDDCICPECPACEEHGNPRCYSSLHEHGWYSILQRNEAQIIGRALRTEAAAAEAEYWSARPTYKDDK